MGDGALSSQRPGLSRPGRGHPGGLNHAGYGNLNAYLYALAERLRKVRVCCGDWSRILGPSPTYKLGLTGVFLDPPYGGESRDDDLYAVDSMDVAAAVRQWAIEHGDNSDLRIALCGYEDEHSEAMPDDWECIAWKARGGYSSQNGDGNDNPHKERIWFSPHCVQPVQIEQMTLEGHIRQEVTHGR